MFPFSLCPVLLDQNKTGFSPSSHRSHGWARRGQKVHGLQNSQRRPRTSLMRLSRSPADCAHALYQHGQHRGVQPMAGAHAAARVALRQRDRAGQRQLPQIRLHTTIGGAGRLPTANFFASRPTAPISIPLKNSGPISNAAGDRLANRLES